MKIKVKKMIKGLGNMASLSGKKGKRMKSLFVPNLGSSIYPSYRQRKAGRKRVNLW